MGVVQDVLSVLPEPVLYWPVLSRIVESSDAGILLSFIVFKLQRKDQRNEYYKWIRIDTDEVKKYTALTDQALAEALALLWSHDIISISNYDSNKVSINIKVLLAKIKDLGVTLDFWRHHQHVVVCNDFDPQKDLTRGEAENYTGFSRVSGPPENIVSSSPSNTTTVDQDQYTDLSIGSTLDLRSRSLDINKTRSINNYNNTSNNTTGDHVVEVWKQEQGLSFVAPSLVRELQDLVSYFGVSFVVDVIHILPSFTTRSDGRSSILLLKSIVQQVAESMLSPADFLQQKKMYSSSNNPRKEYKKPSSSTKRTGPDILNIRPGFDRINGKEVPHVNTDSTASSAFIPRPMPTRRMQQ